MPIMEGTITLLHNKRQLSKLPHDYSSLCKPNSSILLGA